MYFQYFCMYIIMWVAYYAFVVFFCIYIKSRSKKISFLSEIKNIYNWQQITREREEEKKHLICFCHTS